MAILDLRPNCECCDKDLGPADVAYICTYECTFCPDCTHGVLDGICPNCLGNLERRPVRPPAGPVGGLLKHPPQEKRVLREHGCVKPNVADSTKVFGDGAPKADVSGPLHGDGVHE